MRQVIDLRGNIGKADDDTQRKIDELIAELRIEWGDIADQMEPYILAIATDAVNEAALQISVTDKDILNIANANAEEWAKSRAAELVGMSWEDGKLVVNPDAEWSITESTREMIRTDVTTAIDSGMSNDELADLLMNNYSFSPERAEMIARTETATADVQGNMELYREADDNGIKILKQWITAGDDLVSEDCAMNGDSDPIELDDVFPSGASEPPEHPNCRCDILPVIED